MAEAHDPQSLVGAVLAGRYQITSLLGEGGMGAVYLAEHILMRKRVAVKVLHPDMMAVDEVVARFEREAMAGAHIDHPNVTVATDFGKLDDNSFFLVLEYLEGRGLRDELAGGPLGAVRAAHITRQILLALARAHGLGIVHRDLKPENVMLVERDGDPDFVKVLDFGIAKVPVDALTGSTGADAPLTRLGVMYGTPDYMAPEQALGQPVDARADFYALGVMLFEMLLGERPFHSDDPVSVVALHVSTPPPAFANYAAGAAVPPALEALTRRLLAKTADERPANAAEVIAALDAIGYGGAFDPPASRSVAHEVAFLATGVAPAASSAQARARPDAGFAYLPTHAAGRGASPTPFAGAPAAARAASEAKTGPLRSPFAPGGPLTSALALARQRLPTPIARLPDGALTCLFALPLVLVLALVWAFARTPARTAAGDAVGDPVAGDAAAPAAAPGASPAEIQRARAAGVGALETLAAKYPNDANAGKALLAAYVDQGRPGDALRQARALIAVDPAVAADDVVARALHMAAAGPEDVADGAFLALETLPGPEGADVLYDLATSHDIASRTQSRAQKSLAKPEVRERASGGLRLVFDLRAAASCDAKHGLLTRARDEGDRRVLPALKTLAARRGCGLFRRGDCFPCMRRDGLLSDAIEAIERRGGKD